MHFGKILEQDMIEKWRAHYLQYRLLKKHIKDIESMTATNDNIDTSANGLIVNQQITYHEFSFPGPKSHRYVHLSTFKPLLEKEMERVNNFTLSKVNELQNRLMHELRTSAAWDDPEDPLQQQEQLAEFIEERQTDCSKISEELINLDKFIRQNVIAVQKIIKKFDKRLHFDVAPWFHAQLMGDEPFLKVNLDSLLIALSDCYEQLAALKARFLNQNTGSEKGQDEKKGISAQTFERSTTKYWVRAENLMSIKVVIIQNLPIYLFDRKVSADSNRLKNTLKSFEELYRDIQDSSSITSIYFDNAPLDVYHSRLKREEGAQLHRIRWYGDAQSLSTKDHVFMERKTHHESWVDLKSVKERFPLKTERVSQFLQGKFDASQTMHKWMKPDKDGVKLIKSEDELRKANELASEVMSTISEQSLKPMVRTIYRRAAFQARTHNQVRISIDTNLMMVNEDVNTAGMEFSWARDMIASSIPPQDILQFPYCILEVKLNCEKIPPWISDLLADTDLIMERHKFSKFLTGMAYSHYDRIKELPYWFEDQPLIDPKKRFLSMEERMRSGSDFILMDSGSDKLNEKRSRYVVKKSTISESSSSNSEKKEHISIDLGKDDSDAHEDEDSPTVPLIRKISESAIQEQAIGTGVLDSWFQKLRELAAKLKKQKRKQKPIRSQNRVKIEPKTSFANERTLIQWISASSLMITLATLIVTSGTELGFKAGFVFFPLAFLILLYAIIRFQYRAWAFRNRANAYHDDLVGPVVLVIAISSAMGIILSLMFYYNSDLPNVVPLNLTQEGCIEYAHTGIGDTFPYSDLDIVGEKIVTVGPFKLARWHGSKWAAKTFPNQHIVSITSSSYSAQDLIYLGIDKPVPQILELDAKTLETKRSFILSAIVLAYNISFQGLTFVPDRSVNPCIVGHFLVADSHASIFSVSVPREKNNASSCPNNIPEIVDIIPGTRVAWGLYDDPFYKYVSSMDYDQESGTLLVLFGHVRKMRAINFNNGSFLRDWYLPGSSFQWTGVSINRKNGTNERSLFLSQAVPGGIWEFKWSNANDLVTGEFPGCAQVVQEDLLERFVSAGSEKFRSTKMRFVGEF